MRAGQLLCPVEEALSALKIETASCMAEDSIPLCFPENIDGADAPERIAVMALAFARIKPNEFSDALTQTLIHGGACDILAPLQAATFGWRYGLEHLPLAWLNRLGPTSHLQTRVNALFDKKPPRLIPLVHAELLLSEHLNVQVDEPEEPPPLRKRKTKTKTKKTEQLKLL